MTNKTRPRIVFTPEEYETYESAKKRGLITESFKKFLISAFYNEIRRRQDEATEKNHNPHNPNPVMFSGGGQTETQADTTPLNSSEQTEQGPAAANTKSSISPQEERARQHNTQDTRSAKDVKTAEHAAEPQSQ
jgi:hypothetical protein